MSSRVSVVVPTYNGARFIRESLGSVFAQSEIPSEVIVVDDRSTDDTASIVEELARHAPVPLRLVRMPQNTGGPAGPLNAGLAEASSELVVILEQDDLMAPERVARLRAAAERHPECIITIGRLTVVKDGQVPDWTRPVPGPDDIPQYQGKAGGETFVIPSDVAFRSLMRSNFIYTNSNVMLRRQRAIELGGFDPSWPINSDADFEFRALMVSPIAVANAVLCGYRERGDSLYHSRSIRARTDGLLIRLKWGSERLDWAAADVERVYWALRADVASALRAGEFSRAWRIGRAILRSGAIPRHLRQRTSRRGAPS